MQRRMLNARLKQQGWVMSHLKQQISGTEIQPAIQLCYCWTTVPTCGPLWGWGGPRSTWTVCYHEEVVGRCDKKNQNFFRFQKNLKGHHILIPTSQSHHL